MQVMQANLRSYFKGYCQLEQFFVSDQAVQPWIEMKQYF